MAATVATRRRRTGPDEGYDRVRQAIVGGRFQPNERLVEADLTRTFKLGRAAVRTALARLEQDGLVRSEDVVYIQITVFSTRTAAQKKALFRRIAELLGESPGIRPEDVFVNVLDAPKENWSVGHGLAQFA